MGMYAAEPNEVRPPKGGSFARRAERSDGKPARRAYEQNPKEVRRWMEGTYPGIAAQAKAQTPVIRLSPCLFPSEEPRPFHLSHEQIGRHRANTPATRIPCAGLVAKATP